MAAVWSVWRCWVALGVGVGDGWRSGADVDGGAAEMDGDGGGWAAEAHHHAGLAVAAA